MILIKSVYYFDDVSVFKINENDMGNYSKSNEPVNEYDKTRVIRNEISLGRGILIGHTAYDDSLRLKVKNLISPEILNSMYIGDTVVLRNVFFDPSHNVSDASAAQLNLFQKFLQDNKSFEIEIEGHSNIKPTEELNVRYSAQLALKVLYYIKHSNNRVDINRMKFKGCGSSFVGNNIDIDGLISIKLIKKE